MVELDELELAYIAGFFDGEGTITIHHRNASTKKNWYRVCASVSNTDNTLLELLRDSFGGYISMLRRNGNRKDIYQWHITSTGAVVFISAIKPYLRQKLDQADVALEFQSTIYHGHVQGRPVGQTYTDEEVEYKEYLCSVIRELNHRGVG